MGLMGMLVERPLLEGRSKLSQEGGQRFKVVARNGNEIDTMFVQQRTRLSPSEILLDFCDDQYLYIELMVSIR